MTYYSIDVETSSLDVEAGVLLGFAAVRDDGGDTLEALVVDVKPEAGVVIGTIEALDINRGLIERLAKRQAPWPQVDEQALMRLFLDWAPERVVAAGKNFGSFDSRWLPWLNCHHRSFDPGSMWATSGDPVPPNLGTCLLRAGLECSGSRHDAIYDAIDVVQLIRKHWNLPLAESVRVLDGPTLALKRA